MINGFYPEKGMMCQNFDPWNKKIASKLWICGFFLLPERKEEK